MLVHVTVSSVFGGHSGHHETNINSHWAIVIIVVIIEVYKLVVLQNLLIARTIFYLVASHNWSVCLTLVINKLTCTVVASRL